MGSEPPDGGLSRFGDQGFTLGCTTSQGVPWSRWPPKAWRIPGRPRPNPQSRARVSPMVPMHHHLAKQRAMSPCSMSVDSPHTPAVRWKRQLHRGATEARPRSTGLENTSVATGPSQQSIRESVLSIISQDLGLSVSEYSIRLPVRHSCKAKPWHRASPEGHSAAHPMAPSGGPARRQPQDG